MGHNSGGDHVATHSDRGNNRPEQWVTQLGHKPSVRGICLRGSIYQFRVRVPADLRDKIGSSHVKRSLRTDSFKKAVRLSRAVAVEIDALFERKRAEHGIAWDQRLLSRAVDGSTAATTILMRSNMPSDPMLGRTLGEVYECFLNDPTRTLSDRTKLAHHTTRRVVEDVLGSERPIANITREDCRDLLETLRWMPVNLAKKFSDMRVRDAARAAQSDPNIKTINTTNLNAYMSRFATMLNWAVNEEYLGRNPSRGLQVTNTVHPQDRRRPFETWQLRRIFNAPIYTGCRDDGHGYAVVGNRIASGARYWVPLIALLSGMRLNEVCQMDVTDVRACGGVICFVITERSLSGSRDKSLKTKSSERLVPLHPKLLSLGLMAFVEKKAVSGASKLFDDLPLGKRGFRSVAFSRWFSRFLISADASSTRTCFHSFRHGFRDAARNARIDRDIALRLGGWITGGSRSESADDYGSGYRPDILYEAIKMIEFPELDLSHLLERRNGV